MATPAPYTPRIKPLEWPKPLSDEQLDAFDSFMVEEGIEEDIFSARYLLDRLNAETL